MKPTGSFAGQPVRSLQTMLRVIGKTDPSLPTPVPDGIYGSNTAGAVSAFQRRHGITATGIADQDTWEAIVAVYGDAIIEVSPAQPLELILEPGARLKQGDTGPNVYLAQAVLSVLSGAYGSIPLPGLTGIWDIPTGAATSAFQVLARLPATGELDKKTWKYMALHYPLAANLKKLPPNPEKMQIIY